ncbi:hypothetical protein G4G93_17300 [Methylobacterium sp. DB0501]|uniref:hypothetical protein n=1 Tax=Methylobacterium sp. DB0501 TaxID=2709665 RepID=UPI0013EABB4A|nr:hypothetical protein [Methylobacterium sp. DB0501]NGM35656.1 hypothetical protein [Methylobacterium sp. DB0501]
MMSIGAALNAAATVVGHALPAGRAWESLPVRTTREVGEGAGGTMSTAPGETAPGDTVTGEAVLLGAIEAGLREAGYLGN